LPDALLRTALADLREGLVAGDAMFIVLMRRNDNREPVEFKTYRCGLTSLEELGLLHLASTEHTMETLG
jgi:hypothetical protein